MIACRTSIKTIKQRRPRQSEEAAKLHITMPTNTALKLKGMELLLLFVSAFLHFYQCLVSPSPELRGSVHLFPKLVSYKINCAKLTLYPLPLAQIDLTLNLADN